MPETVTFGSSDIEQTFSVAAVDDLEDDDGEAIVMRFGELPARVLAASPETATVTLDDNDVSVRWERVAYAAAEGGPGATVAVRLSETPDSPLTIPVTATPGGGAMEADYTGVPENVVFTADETAYMFTVDAVDDEEDDDGETVTLGVHVAELRVGVAALEGIDR